jgi:hypothetical protein
MKEARLRHGVRAAWRRDTRDGTAGWVLFSSTVLVMLGVFAVTMGLAALFSDDVFVVSDEGLLVFDFTEWGVIRSGRFS